MYPAKALQGGSVDRALDLYSVDSKFNSLLIHFCFYFFFFSKVAFFSSNLIH